VIKLATPCLIWNTCCLWPYSDPAAADRLVHLEAGQLRQQIFLTVRDVLLKQASERPLVIILDDLHWADDASLELLLYLLEVLRQAPIFILANSRLIYHTG